MVLRDERRSYGEFAGTVGRTMSTSEPWWPSRPVAPDGAPNVVIMLADDLGFSDLGCYGSEIATPNLDAMAARGFRYANFHVTPLCSPTRAALLTGRNPHSVGMGMVANIDPGFPGYTSQLPSNQPTIAEVLRGGGYSTLMVGKWHLCRDSDLSEAGDKSSWPLQRGFDQYYGFLEALTNFHHPHRLYEGNSVVQVDRYPDGYYLTDDLTDRAIRMVREVKTADSDKPFFLYFAHGAVHAPLHAKPDDIAKYRGRYDVGWDRLREERLARQKALGLVPQSTELPPRNSEPGEDVVAWDSLSERERTMFARYMEVYAAMVDNIDQNVGRLVASLQALRELDNTIFIFTSDNGASREGRDAGTLSYFRDSGTLPDKSTRVSDEDLAQIELIGGPRTWPHYPRGWAMACNTPFRLYKLTAFRGGNQVPMILSWPDRYPAGGDVVRRQYTHVTDILPTLIDIIGVPPMAARHGEEAAPLVGASFAGTIEDSDAVDSHTEQYIEVVGHRGFYRDGWEIAAFHEARTPFSKDRWELFDARADLNQRRDLASDHPERVAELSAAWEEAAWENRVFPLEEGSRLSQLWRPESDQRFSKPLRILPGTPTLERWRSSRLIAGRSFRIMVDLEYTGRESGVLVAHGGQAGGYVMYIEDGALGFVYNDGRHVTSLEAAGLPAGTAQVGLVAEAPGKGRWNMTVCVGGEPVARAEGLQQFLGFLPYEGIDVGIDRRSPVSWDLYERHGAFPFDGRLAAVVYEPGDRAPDAGQVAIEQARAVGFGLE